MPTYRYELASSNRAACQNSVCKTDGPKIQKGELRFGNLCSFEDRDFWKWKHWGCVTPIQIANVQKDIDGLDIDDDEDMMVLDGWEELPDWAKEKIKQALKDGHVADEDWKGDPEKNRPGQKGINSARRKKKTKGDENPDEAGLADETPVKAKKKRMTKKDKEAAAAAEEEAEDEFAEREDTPVPVKKKRGKKVREEEPDESAEEVIPAKKKRAAPKRRKVKAEEDDIKAEDEEVVPEPPKQRARVRKEKVKKEEGIDDAFKAEEDAVAEALPKIKGRAKKAKREELDADEPMPILADRPAVKKEEVDMVQNEEEAGNVPMADLPGAKSTKRSRVTKVKAEPEAENNEGLNPTEAKPTKKPRAKKFKQKVKEEPVEDEQADEPEHQGGVEFEVSLVKTEPGDMLAGLPQNDEPEPAEEAVEEPKSKKGKKGAKRKAR